MTFKAMAIVTNQTSTRSVLFLPDCPAVVDAVMKFLLFVRANPVISILSMVVLKKCIYKSREALGTLWAEKAAIN